MSNLFKFVHFKAYTQNLITRCIPEASATIDWDQNDMTTEVLRSHDDYEDENLAVNLTSRDVNLSSKSKEPQNSAVNGEHFFLICFLLA